MRRLALTVVTLAGVVVAVFFMTHILPGNPAVLRAGPLANEELIARYEQEMGLDQPLYVQFADYARALVRMAISAKAGARTSPCAKNSPNGCPPLSNWR